MADPGRRCCCLHGNPQNHVAWHKIASRLAKNYHVVLPDLRGYGDSSLPEPGPNHINYSFRAMAQDMVEVMEQLGYRQFYLAGHDRGGRTSHRMCLDHPERVMKVCLDRRPAQLLCVDEYHQSLGDRHLALGLHGAA